MRHRDERAHERAERFDVVIDAAQQHRLRQHRNARIDQPRAGRARLLRQLARMIGVQHDERRLVGAQRRDQRRVDPLRRHDRHARVHADHAVREEWPRAAARRRRCAAPKASADRRPKGSPPRSADGSRHSRAPQSSAAAESASAAPARPFRGGSRSGNRPRRHGRASAARGRDSGARCPSTGVKASSPIGSARSSGAMSSSPRIGHELPRDRIVGIVAVDQIAPSPA